MTPKERDVIRRFARGDRALREKAIAIYRSHLRGGSAQEAVAEMKFMSEVDNPCPDYILRSVYRKRLTGE